MKVALGVSGGIAAYKAAEVVRLLQERGIRVQVIMTRAAQEFIRPLTFAALSGEKVITDMFAPGDEQPNIDSAVEHIAVAQSIDALAVVPATADVLGKFAQGLATDFLSGSRDERQHVGACGYASEPGDSAQARGEDRRTGQRVSGLWDDGPGTACGK